MLLQPTDDQDFFRETTARFLEDRAPADELRRLDDHEHGFDDDYWRQGAELGWTSLLVAPEHGGGSISGDGLADLTLVAHEFGAHAAPGPLIPSNLVAAALSDADGHPDLLGRLLDGTALATWCHSEVPNADRFDAVALEIQPDGDEVVLTGQKRPVESASRADHLLVTGRTGDGLSQVVVPTAAPGVSIEPMHSVDLTRRFAAVSFDAVRVRADAVLGRLGEAGTAVDRQLRLGVVMTNAQSVGAMQTAFDMTVEWAFDRYSFGRPLASYQALKHRFADMKTWLEAAHAVSDDACAAVAAAAPDADRLSSAAKAFIGEYGAELLQDCVQLHGGIGVTYEHDLHLYLRRVTLDRTLFGTPSDHRRRLGVAASRDGGEGEAA